MTRHRLSFHVRPRKLSAAPHCSTRYGILQTTCTSLQRCIFRETARLHDTSASPPFNFEKKISQQLHLHLQLYNFVDPFHFFACRLFARASLGARYISRCNSPFFPILTGHELFHLVFCQTMAFCYLPVRFSICFSLADHFC